MSEKTASIEEAIDNLPREQCYICWTYLNDAPPKQSRSMDELRHDHHEYLLDLERLGILLGAGSLRDEEGKRHGAGMFIIRAKTRKEAETLAFKEPYVAAGIRTVELTPWQRSAGSITLTLQFSNGHLKADTREFTLTAKRD